MTSVDAVIALLSNIAERPPDVSFGAYIEYVQYTIGMLREVQRGDYKTSLITEEIECKLLEKARVIYQRYFSKKVTLAPEMEYVVLFRAYTRTPFFSWTSEIKETKRERIRRLIMKCGQILTAGFRLWGKIVLIDFDIIQGPSEIADKLREVIKEITYDLGLPIKYTWHKGVHAYIPLKLSDAPRALLVQDGVAFKHRARPIILEGNGVKIRVEFLIDAVTHHPLLSWLWLELDDQDKPSDVTLARCAVPINHPAENWFVFGRSISYPVQDVNSMIKDLFERLCKALKLSISGEVPGVMPASEDLLKKAIADIPSDMKPFREGVQISEGVGGGTHAFRRLDLRKCADIYLFAREVDYDLFMSEIVPKLADRELLPKCVDYMILSGEDLDPDVIKHWVFIVAWFLLQQMKCWWLNREVASKLCPHVASLHGFRQPRVYYYYYYAWSLVYDPLMEDYRFARPNSIPQLSEAYHEIANSHLCKKCRFNIICRHGNPQKVVSTRLLDVINFLAFEIMFEHHDIAKYLDPDVQLRFILRPTLSPRGLIKVTHPEFERRRKDISQQEASTNASQ